MTWALPVRIASISKRDIELTIMAVAHESMPPLFVIRQSIDVDYRGIPEWEEKASERRAASRHQLDSVQKHSLAEV